MSNEFKNKVIFITGASSGIGFQLANLFLKNKAKIVSVSRTKPKIKKNNRQFKHINFDLTNFKKYDELFKKIPKAFGPIDFFVHAAGLQFIKPIKIVTSEDINRILDINLKSPIFISKFLSNKKIFKRPCSVVFIASIMGVVGSPGQSLYSSSKSGIIGLTKSLSLELSKSNIRVNCVSPGVIKSPLFDNYLKQVTSDMKKKVIENHPLGIGSFKDINMVIKFLLSSESKWMTGQNIIVDGGYTVQ